jgi:hypothetical protein
MYENVNITAAEIAEKFNMSLAVVYDTGKRLKLKIQGVRVDKQGRQYEIFHRNNKNRGRKNRKIIVPGEEMENVEETENEDVDNINHTGSANWIASSILSENNNDK